LWLTKKCMISSGKINNKFIKMEELLREAFKLGQQWVKDINDEKEPESFTEWFNKRKQAINYTHSCTDKLWI